eukprot:875147-Alexandrium_andersonii.AAC.1
MPAPTPALSNRLRQGLVPKAGGPCSCPLVRAPVGSPAVNACRLLCGLHEVRLRTEPGSPRRVCGAVRFASLLAEPAVDRQLI